MAVVNITINGQKVEALTGQTVLEAAAAAGFEIPTLCNHPALKPQGSCRMCLVEIEKQRGLQPACTFPVSEGMSIQTHSLRVENARRFVLELLFSERIHYCMYCSMSGSEDTTQCELQRLAYQYGLTSWQYPPNTNKRWPVDASRKYFVMDHSRCILCRRCIRACDEIAANHTLGVRDRGARTMIIADTDVPFGESTCVSCGTCLQVCPTGALMDRRSAYMGHQPDVERTRTTCLGCPVGCGVEAVTRSNLLLRVEGDWEAANQGLLCVHGRFETVEPQPARVTTPLVRAEGGELKPASWDEALALVARRLRLAGTAAGLASSRLTSEVLAAFRSFFMGCLRSEEVALLSGELPPFDIGPAASLADLQRADLILVVAGDPLEDQKVLGYTVRRQAEAGVRLVVVSDAPTGLDPWAQARLPLDRLAEIAAEIAAARQPVLLYGPGLDSLQYVALAALPKVRLMPLYKGANTAGAMRAGYRVAPVEGSVLYVLAGDETSDGQGLPVAALPVAGFTVVQSAYRNAWTAAADVVLPAPTWTERAGHVVNLEGRDLAVVPALRSPEGVQPETVTLARLAECMAG